MANSRSFYIATSSAVESNPPSAQAASAVTIPSFCLTLGVSPLHDNKKTLASPLVKIQLAFS